MEVIFLSGLSLIIVVGAIVALIMRAIGQPLMIGHIITGIIVGPTILHIAKNQHDLEIFAQLGIALLLFIIGLGMNPKVVKEVGKASTVTAIIEILVVGSLGWIAGILLGLSPVASLFLGFGLAINSTIVALKLLSDKRETNRLYGKLTIGTSLVEDIVVAIALLLIASSQGGELLALGPFLKVLLFGSLLGFGMYIFTRKVFPYIQRLVASDQEMLFLFAIAWGLGIGALFAKIGFSLEVGAFAAGVFIAHLPYAQEISSRLRPLRDFFVIVFFIALGAGITFDNFGAMILPILAGLAIVLFFKPFVVMVTLGLLGYTKRTSFKTATMLTHVSEFSMIFVILGSRQGLIDQQLVTILTFVAIISIAISTYIITFNDKLYGVFEKYLDLFERRKTQSDAVVKSRYDLILFGYQRGGHEYLNVFRKISNNYVVVDYDPEVIDTLEHRKIKYLYGDATDEELMDEAGVGHAKLIVSTMSAFEVNSFLLDYLKRAGSRAVVIVQADKPDEATELYKRGASYVTLPHYIGSEQISTFISRSGFSKETFRKFRAKHLQYLEEQLGLAKESHHQEKKFGETIVKGVAALTKTKP